MNNLLKFYNLNNNKKRTTTAYCTYLNNNRRKQNMAQREQLTLCLNTSENTTLNM
jgi:hypothetical protein